MWALLLVLLLATPAYAGGGPEEQQAIPPNQAATPNQGDYYPPDEEWEGRIWEPEYEAVLPTEEGGSFMPQLTSLIVAVTGLLGAWALLRRRKESN